MSHATLTEYERLQTYNPLVAWLHSFRYRYILTVIRRLASTCTHPIRVVDVGSAQSKLFGLLNARFDIDYTGIEPAEVFTRAATERYGALPNFRVLQDFAENRLPGLEADVVVCFETLEHIEDGKVGTILDQVTALRPRAFVCSVPVEVGPSIWLKNGGSLLIGYIRHREYSWKETFWAGLDRLDKLPPHEVRHKGFDWRRLVRRIRRRMAIREIRRFPFPFLPSGLAASVFIVAEP